MNFQSPESHEIYIVQIKDKYNDLLYRGEDVPPSPSLSLSLSACLAVIFIENKIIAQRWRRKQESPPGFLSLIFDPGANHRLFC